MSDEVCTLSALPWPLTDSNCASLRHKLLKNCARLAPNAADWKPFLPDKDLRFLLERAIGVLEHESTVVDVALTLPNPDTVVERISPGVTVVQPQPDPSSREPPSRVCVVGDIHGQVFDLCSILDKISMMEPPIHTVVFTGDYVDRGSWGVECLIALLTLKLRGVQATGIRIHRSRSPSPQRKGGSKSVKSVSSSLDILPSASPSISQLVSVTPPPSLATMSLSEELLESSKSGGPGIIEGSVEDGTVRRGRRNSISSVGAGHNPVRHSQKKKFSKDDAETVSLTVKVGEKTSTSVPLTPTTPSDESCDEQVRSLIRAARRTLVSSGGAKESFIPPEDNKTDSKLEPLLIGKKTLLHRLAPGTPVDCGIPPLITTTPPPAGISTHDHAGFSTPDLPCISGRRSRPPKVVRPFPNVVLLRGNHESSSCITTYGFAAEVKSKYSLSMLPLFRKLFAALPLAAIVRCGRASTIFSGSASSSATSGSANSSETGSNSSVSSSSPSLQESASLPHSSSSSSTSSASSGTSHRQKLSRGVIMVHGGLWRSRADVRKAVASAASSQKSPMCSPLMSPGITHQVQSGPIQTGTLKELRALQRTRYEDAVGASILSDVLWSDPGANPGVIANSRRAMSITYGPDASAAFLKAHRLVMLIRSHEGPDARDKRKGEMPDVDSGYSIDHHWPDSDDPSVVTVFSAPAYPQFKTGKKESGRNTRGAYAVLNPVELLSTDSTDVVPSVDDPTGSPEKHRSSSHSINVKWNISFVEFDAEPRPPGIKYPHL